ncbi:MAG: hypothetical protein IT373_07650 [Polyangiaceae bacterium]|nr:hypothetical protein [Polyangiaceae bacterium]
MVVRARGLVTSGVAAGLGLVAAVIGCQLLAKVDRSVLGPGGGGSGGGAARGGAGGTPSGGASCGSSSDCGASQFCDPSVAGGTCLSRKGNGEPCVRADECASGHCPEDEGVCCAAVCAAGGCVAGVLHEPEHCDGSGQCAPGTETPCPGGLGCLDAVSCRASCALDGDCASAAAHCEAGACVPDLPNGGACDEASDCASGSCPADDGVCCDTTCADKCEACLGSKTGGADGACAAVALDTDPDGDCGGDKCCRGIGTCGGHGC